MSYLISRSELLNNIRKEESEDDSMKKENDCDNCEHNIVEGDRFLCDCYTCDYKPMTQLVGGITECCGYDFGMDGFGKAVERINYCPVCGKKIWK